MSHYRTHKGVFRRQAMISALYAVACLAGCASNPSVSSLTSEQRQKIAEMVIFKPGTSTRSSYQVLGSDEGLACKRNLYASGSPSYPEAEQGVRIRAAQLGADAIANMACEEKHEVDWGRNCWQTVVCVGDAIAVVDKALLSHPRK